MNADLLSRAATRLRRNVAALPADWRDRPWTRVITDSESLTGVRTCDGRHDSYEVVDGADPASIADWACDRCEHFETHSEGLADYVSTLHPSVALALADLLDAYVRADAPFFGRDHLMAGADQVIAVAREVLREDGEWR